MGRGQRKIADGGRAPPRSGGCWNLNTVAERGVSSLQCCAVHGPPREDEHRGSPRPAQCPGHPRAGRRDRRQVHNRHLQRQRRGEQSAPIRRPSRRGRRAAAGDGGQARNREGADQRQQEGQRRAMNRLAGVEAGPPVMKRMGRKKPCPSVISFSAQRIAPVEAEAADQAPAMKDARTARHPAGRPPPRRQHQRERGRRRSSCASSVATSRPSGARPHEGFARRAQDDEAETSSATT